MADITEQLNAWADELQAIARNGLIWSPSGYDRERYGRLLEIASTMFAVLNESIEVDSERAGRIRDLLDSLVVDGVAGYARPKSSVAAVVFNESRELLLVQRSDSGFWTLPTGWSDIGFSPAEVAAKEVREETGLDVHPLHLMGVYDTRKHQALAPFQIYALLFYCDLGQIIGKQIFVTEGKGLIRTYPVLGLALSDGRPVLITRRGNDGYDIRGGDTWSAWCQTIT